jgi:hypothetical protein
MPLFTVDEVVPCYVTFRSVIEAATPEAAYQIMRDGVSEQTIVGESIGFLDARVEVDGVPFTPPEDDE